MIRSILNQRRVDLSALTAKFSTKPPFYFRTESNDVKILGTVVKDSSVLPSGTKNVIIKTTNSTNYTNHVVRFRSSQDFHVGQRVYITGTLKSTQKFENGEKLRSEFVRAEGVHILESESEPKQDLNVVSIVANVASDVYDNFDDFVVATHFTRNTDSGNTEVGTYFHDVRFSNAIRQYAQTNLKKGDRVLVCGRLKRIFRSEFDQHSGCIIANSISKISKAHQSPSSESAPNDSEQETIHITS